MTRTHADLIATGRMKRADSRPTALTSRPASGCATRPPAPSPNLAQTMATSTASLSMSTDRTLSLSAKWLCAVSRCDRDESEEPHDDNSGTPVEDDPLPRWGCRDSTHAS